MKYIQYKPKEESLRPYVEYYNSLIGDKVKDTRFISLPEGKIGIVFMLNGHDRIDTTNNCIIKKTSHIHGLAQSHMVVETSADVHTFSIIFKPAAIYNFIPSVPINELARSYANLEDVFGKEVLDVEDQLYHCKNDEERINIVEKFLLKNRVKTNRRINAAATAIICSEGNIKVKDVAQKVNLSNRQLQNIFKFNVGVSTKQFIKLSRFKRAINTTPNPKASMAEIGCNLGYYDESHFISEFKMYSGITPRRFYSNRSYISDFSNYKRLLLS